MTRPPRYITRLFPVVLLVAVIALASSGRMSHRTAVSVSAAAEALILLIGVALAIPMWRRASASKAGGWQALESALTVLVPQPIARLMALEPRLWASIFVWLRRRPRQPEDFSYHQGSLVGMFVLVSLFSAPVEILLAELLIPWSWLRLALLLASIYTVIWLLGYAASLATLPHRLEREGLRLRYGLFTEALIPYTTIASATRERRAPRGGRDGVSVDQKAGAVYLTVGGQTAVTLDLREPVTVQRLFAPTPPVTRAHIAVDDARGFVEALCERLASAPANCAPQAQPTPPIGG